MTALPSESLLPFVQNLKPRPLGEVARSADRATKGGFVKEIIIICSVLTQNADMRKPPSDEGGGTRQRDGRRDHQRWFSRCGIECTDSGSMLAPLTIR